ncbi:flavin reductase family protein [Cellulomonas sp. KH9]|uniref:flavin reductase family protein n=1 Tax=Cellulomonas sp. KH9 TaxID=1855324 RepID=UPI0008E47085|nr:flavin reductase family protein [Cellulomonas sp. KH9]SFJ74149.1 NADH-FMN oxidoreductase RutF, flavin reductase (DIM6/NTAB) family [Cellulomonas sp. KH9]
MTTSTHDLQHLERLLADHDEPALTPEEYKQVFRRHAAGVAVVTLRDADRLVGFTATSVISVSAAPPLLAFSLASGSSSWPALSRAATVAVSFLAEGQEDVSTRFATSGIDRFAAGGWTPLPTGEPVVDGAQAWVRGRIVQRTPVGDSHLVSLRALSHGVTCARPLVYRDRVYHRLTP